MSISPRQEEEKSRAQQSYFGYSFEAFSTTDSKTNPSKVADKTKKKKIPADISVNTNVQWCCVVKAKIGSVRLYMGGEVDCVDGKYKLNYPAAWLTAFAGTWLKDMGQCVELKTNMVMESQRQRSNFERYRRNLSSRRGPC
jgi:RAT1-interacting protein